MPIVRRLIRDEVKDVLREEIISGVLEPGTRLQEIDLVERLGVSRTPVREALHKLEEEGLVINEAHKGCFVAPISKKKVEEIYPILGTLEALSVSLCESFDSSVLEKLKTLNKGLKSAPSTEERGKLDREWHQVLHGQCQNEHLIETISALNKRAAQYDQSVVRGVADVEGSCCDHDNIIAALEAGDISLAVDHIKTHWRNGIVTVHRWLDARNHS